MIRDLEDNGILISGNFNRVKSDRTKWCTISYEKTGPLLVSSPEIPADARGEMSEDEEDDNGDVGIGGLV